MTDWIEIKITVSSCDTEKASDIANSAVDYGIYIEDYSDLEEMSWEISHIDLIDEDLVSKDRTKSIIHLYVPEDSNPIEKAAYLSERLNSENIANEIITENIGNPDWLEGWKKYFKPIEVGEKLAVCPSWEKYDNLSNRKVLQIDPGAAFGTGTHETTNLCLSVLDKMENNGKSILDVGCGSGILALSALLLGCKDAIGVDIDPVAIKVANENAEINNLKDKSKFVCGDLVDKISGKYDIICANIVADVIILLCDSILDFMHDDTTVVFSGIIKPRENDVINKINSVGLEIEQKLYKSDWVALVCKRR